MRNCQARGELSGRGLVQRQHGRSIPAVNDDSSKIDNHRHIFSRFSRGFRWKTQALGMALQQPWNAEDRKGKGRILRGSPRSAHRLMPRSQRQGRTLSQNANTLTRKRSLVQSQYGPPVQPHIRGRGRPHPRGQAARQAAVKPRPLGPIPIAGHRGQDSSVPEDQPVARASTAPLGSPQPSPGTAGTPE